MMGDHHSQLDIDPNKPMQHNNYDESIENEYAMSSNTRNRRVIHEIIVWDPPRVRFADEPCLWLKSTILEEDEHEHE